MTHPDDCQCQSLESKSIVRQQRWREICAKFYFDQDRAAKRVFEYYEASKRDEISIATEEGATVEDGEFNELVLMLGLFKCTMPGHEENLSRTIQMLEVVKNDVRARYHDHVSHERYAEFHARAKESQGTNFKLWTNDKGEAQVSVRIQHDYLRSRENYSKMMNRVEVFIKKHLPNVGCHPFLVGLRAALQWNLESSTVVAWKLSDSVFIESGDFQFTHNALALLVATLNFSHCEQIGKSDSCGGSIQQTRVKIRHWYLDPFLSDHDIRQLIRRFPAIKRLDGKPTGTKVITKIDRVNVHGQQDETRPFFKRWCLVL
ncbi:unnamed protein product [Peronospora belbahrii]|uniref:Uncharacterized protein n=1 Tax=Peronospora belbahrii TaxID=622444 RepID=A0AAU9KQD7_9STRA|nr:unnamed protein product [Peronospora belbahrii]CAH0516214.1 unnamed protein product [Peronospora belbahrii]